jgi:DNA mismatch endonuclease, patch repair protein
MPFTMIADTPEPRRRIMRAIKSHDTQPELIVRRLAHRMGYRFRLHRKDLPGRPDLVFPAKHKVIFVNGCFWHSHNCGGIARVPAQNTAYWDKKLARTIQRDRAALATLTALGWEVSVFWECELKNLKSVERRLRAFLM